LLKNDGIRLKRSKLAETEIPSPRCGAHRLQQNKPGCRRQKKGTLHCAEHPVNYKQTKNIFPNVVKAMFV